MTERGLGIQREGLGIQTKRELGFTLRGGDSYCGELGIHIERGAGDSLVVY